MVAPRRHHDPHPRAPGRPLWSAPAKGAGRARGMAWSATRRSARPRSAPRSPRAGRAAPARRARSARSASAPARPHPRRGPGRSPGGRWWAARQAPLELRRDRRREGSVHADHRVAPARHAFVVARAADHDLRPVAYQGLAMQAVRAANRPAQDVSDAVVQRDPAAAADERPTVFAFDEPAAPKAVGEDPDRHPPAAPGPRAGRAAARPPRPSRRCTAPDRRCAGPPRTARRPRPRWSRWCGTPPHRGSATAQWARSASAVAAWSIAGRTRRAGNCSDPASAPPVGEGNPSRRRGRRLCFLFDLAAAVTSAISPIANSGRRGKGCAGAGPKGRGYEARAVARWGWRSGPSSCPSPRSPQDLLDALRPDHPADPLAITSIESMAAISGTEPMTAEPESPMRSTR